MSVFVAEVMPNEVLWLLVLLNHQLDKDVEKSVYINFNNKELQNHLPITINGNTINYQKTAGYASWPDDSWYKERACTKEERQIRYKYWKLHWLLGTISQLPMDNNIDTVTHDWSWGLSQDLGNAHSCYFTSTNCLVSCKWHDCRCYSYGLHHKSDICEWVCYSIIAIREYKESSPYIAFSQS